MGVCALATSEECAHNCECKKLTEAWLAAHPELVSVWGAASDQPQSA